MLTPSRRKKRRRTAKSSPKLFMKLPAEIRNEVYDLALDKNKKFEVGGDMRGSQFRKMFGFPLHWREPPLLQASKQIQKEALPVFYSSRNHFGICLRDGNLKEACVWIKERHMKCGYGDAGEAAFDLELKNLLDMKLNKKPWIQLTSLFFELDLGKDYNTDPRIYWKGLNPFYPSPDIDTRIQGLGRYEKLKRSFQDWAQWETLSTKL